MKSNLLTAINDLIEGYFSCVSENLFDGDDIHDLDLEAVIKLIDDYINYDDEEYFNENISLLSIEYYNIMCNLKGVDCYSNDDDIIDNMKELSKKEYINYLIKENENILNIFVEIINEYIDDFPILEYQYSSIDNIMSFCFPLYMTKYPSKPLFQTCVLAL